MADLDPIERKLILNIEEHLAGALKAAGELRAVGDAAKKASAGLDKYIKTVEKAANEGNKAAKAWMHMVGSAKLLTQATRRVGAAFVASTGILSKLWDSLVKNNQAFMDLTLVSMNTSNVVARLQATVDKSRGSFDQAATSYRDAAEALSTFKGQSIDVATALESIPDFKKKFASVFETLSQKTGQDTAQALLSELQGFGLAGFQVEKALSILSKGTKKSGAELVQFVGNIDPANVALARWANEISNAFAGMNEPLSKSVADWKAFWSRLTTMFEQFGTKLFASVGEKLPRLFANIESHYPAIITGVGKAIDWLSSHTDELVDIFNEVINAISASIEWFSNLGTTMKVIIGLGAGSALLPGFAPALLSIAGGAISLGKHLLGLSSILLGPITSSFASVAKSLPFATTAMKVFGVASKVATTILGPLGIAIGAAYLAFDQFKTWYSKGPDSTWGEKLMDWWSDYDDKLDKINKKHIKYERSWLGFGNKEVSNVDAEKEIFKRKKDMGTLAPDEQTFEEFYKKRQKILQDSDARNIKRNKDRIAAEKKTQEEITNAATKAADEQNKRAEESQKKIQGSKGIDIGVKFGTSATASMDEFNRAWAKALSMADKDDLSQAVATLAIAGDKWKSMLPDMEGAESSAQHLSSLIETMGPSPQMRQAASEQAAYITSMVPQWKKLADIQVAAAKAEVAAAETGMAREAAKKRLSAEMAKQAKVAEMIRISTELTTKANEKSAEVEDLRVQASKTTLQIAQGIYGAAGLSVKAQMNVVEGLQKEKEYLKAAHREILKKIADGDHTIVTQEKELTLRNKILSVTADQVNMLKELRDGYLSAVQAQAFGAGKFEKIIIAQEKNLRAGLDKGMVKANFLLGTVGEAAKLSDVPIARFSSGGYGLEKLGGGMMTDDDTKKWQKELIKNIPGAISKAAAAAATQITFESMDQLDSSLGQVDKSVDAFDAVVNKSIDSMKRFGATMDQNASSSVVFGEALRSGKVPAAVTPTNRGPETTGGRHPTARPNYGNANVRNATPAGGRGSGPGPGASTGAGTPQAAGYSGAPSGSGIPQAVVNMLPELITFGKTIGHKAINAPSQLSKKAQSYSQIAKVGVDLTAASAQSEKLAALKKTVESTKQSQIAANAKYGELSAHTLKLSEQIIDKPKETVKLAFGYSDDETLKKYQDALAAEKELSHAQRREGGEHVLALRANAKYDKAQKALREFHREYGSDQQIKENLRRAQSALPKPIAEPTLQTVAAASAAESQSKSRRPRGKKDSIGGGTGGGRATQLVREGVNALWGKLSELASMVDESEDDDAQVGDNRSGREGITTIPR